MAGLGLSGLNALRAVAKHGNFRSAATALEMSPSSLSHMVANIERLLGIRLFNRTTRSVALTAAGEQFLARIQPALREIEDAVEAVNHLRDTPAGQLRINTSHGAAERLMPIILDFMTLYPEMRVDLFTEGRMVDIVAEGFDAGLRYREAIPQDMVALSLGLPEAMIVVGSPGYFERHGVPDTPVELLNHECIRARLPSGAPLRWEFERSGEEIRIDVGGRLIVGSPDLSQQAACAGVGLAYVDARSAQADLRSAQLRQVLNDWTPEDEGLCLYYPRQRLPSAGLRAFIAHFQVARAPGLAKKLLLSERMNRHP
jgi:DNA-binding transcriptional LysR family regulator